MIRKKESGYQTICQTFQAHCYMYVGMGQGEPTLIALPLMFRVFMQKSTPMVGIPADVNTPSVYRRTMLVFPTPASPIQERGRE